MSVPDITRDQLHSALTTLQAVRRQARRDPRFAFDEPWQDFATAMRMLTPQSYGVRFQNRLAEFYGWKVIPSNLDRGDVVTAGGEHREVKVSVLDQLGQRVNFVQIRPHQDIAGYDLFVVQPGNEVVHFALTKEQMAGELEMVGTLAHGTKAAAAGHTNRELAIRFDWTPTEGVAQRWLQRYLAPGPVPR